MIDTLKISKRLVAAGAQPALADALAEAESDAFGAAASAGPDLSQLATKEDLERFATKADLERFATKEELTALRGEMREDFASVRAEIAQSSNRLLMWLIPLLLAQVGALLLLILRQGGAL